MKKFIALLTAVLLVFVLVGCGSEPSHPEAEIRVAALKGPTGLGMVHLIDKSDNGKTENSYKFELAGAPDEISAKLIKGELDIAAVPTNLAATLYRKTEGEVKIAAINTLGVLYILENGDSIQEIGDLAGKTLYATGLGSTPEYALNYILEKNGLSDSVTVEYKTEHSELAALMASGDVEIALLPQPFVTSVTANNADIRIALDVQAEWESAAGIPLSMGCIVVRTEFLEQYPEAAAKFLEEYRESAEAATSNAAETAALSEKYDIMAAKVAEAAIPRCGIVCITGNEMKSAAEQFLAVLYEADPTSVGGAVPDEDFYWLP